ncbi:MAG TPA: AMP-binding protein [Acidimicrobiales bacterium]|nr:AMP-binding protein [Acidimicrobiales bacterium]
MNLAVLADQHAAGDRALYEGGTWFTWGEVRRRAGAVAAALVALGVGPDDRVAIAWPTSVDFVVAYLGVLAAGAVAVPLNPNSPANELGRELRVVEPAVLLAAGAAAAVPRVPHVVLPAEVVAAMGEKARDAEVWEEFSAAGEEAAEAAAQDAAPPEGAERAERVEPTQPATTGPEAGADEEHHLHPTPRQESDLAVLLFTSGTAGDPKAAMLSHGNLMANLRQMLGIPEIFRADDVGLVALPLFHVFGLNVALGLCLATGAALVLDTRFDASESLKQVHDLGVTTLLGVPTMFAAWADAPGEDPNGPSRLAGVRRAISGAAALDPEAASRFESRYGITIWQGYGLTEASPAVSTSLGTGRNRPGSVGRPLPGVEVQLVDEDEEPVLDGDPGEIWVRGANVFGGYWHDPTATSRVLTDDGWLRTGDIGVIGEEGDLFVVDRSKDLVIVSGFNVFPAEVERVVASVPGVAEVAVIGRPDASTGETVEAVIVAAPGGAVTEELVRAYCAANLTLYKCPTSIRFVAELPHGLAGKALRKVLRDQPA